MKKTITESQVAWDKKYGHLSEADRAVLVKSETTVALQSLKDVKPTMSAEELDQLTRGPR